MGRTANVFARVEPEVKKQAEEILGQLGIPMSNAVGMFLRQVVMQKGLPFEVKIKKPLCLGNLSKNEFNAEMSKAVDDIREGRIYSAEEVEEELKRDFGI